VDVDIKAVVEAAQKAANRIKQDLPK
jgi:hypothetical protein